MQEDALLNKVKDILLVQNQRELNKKKQLEIEFEHLLEQEKQENFVSIDREITRIQSQITDETNHFWKRLLHGKKINEWNQELLEKASSKFDILKKYSTQKEELLAKIHEAAYKEGLIDKKIMEIKNATTLQELNLTKEEALDLLEKNDTNAIIKLVFSDILENTPLNGKQDIFSVMRTLFQTNTSPFVKKMKIILSDDLLGSLLDIGISIDREKAIILKKIGDYKQTKDISLIEDIKYLLDNFTCNTAMDRYYKKEATTALGNLQTMPNLQDNIISQLTTLTILTSIANNQKEKVQENIQK